MVRRWRGLEEPSFETLHSLPEAEGSRFQSNVVVEGKTPFVLEYEWRLDPFRATEWVVLRLVAERVRTLRIARAPDGEWTVDGERRSDLDRAAEVDLSATPFCNSIPLWRGLAELDTVYVQLPDLTVVRSRQHYEPLGERRVRYVDLGAAAGFTAVLDLDEEGFVVSYEGLFESAAEYRF